MEKYYVVIDDLNEMFNELLKSVKSELMGRVDSMLEGTLSMEDTAQCLATISFFSQMPHTFVGVKSSAVERNEIFKKYAKTLTELNAEATNEQ